MELWIIFTVTALIFFTIGVATQRRKTSKPEPECYSDYEEPEDEIEWNGKTWANKSGDIDAN